MEYEGGRERPDLKKEKPVGMAALTPKQQAFVNAWVSTDPSIRTLEHCGKIAGYKNPVSGASSAMANETVKRAIKAAEDRIAREAELQGSQVTEELMKIAFFNIQDFLDEEGGLKNLTRVKRKQLAAVSSIKETSRVVGKDENAREIKTTEVRFFSKLDALTTLAKIAGLMTDNKTINVNASIEHKVSGARDLLAERLMALSDVEEAVVVPAE